MSKTKYSLLTDPTYSEFFEWLRGVVNAECLARIDPNTGYEEAAEAWLDSIDDEGYIEVRDSCSANGHPVLAHFPELAPEPVDD